MNRLTLLCALVLWIGAVMVLTPLRWFRTPPLLLRLAPYRGGTRAVATRAGVLSSQSLNDLLAPLAAGAANRISRLLGIGDELSSRLRRIDSPYDANGFRMRQVTWTATVLAMGAGLTLLVAIPTPVALLVVLGAPILTYLVIEQQVVTDSKRWQQRLLLELPVLIEQLGMLLSSGYSLGSAVARLAGRGRGVAARGLTSVTVRMRQGVSEIDALREWAELADVAALDRLVTVLAMNWEAGDLGTLIANEARSVRRDVQRAQIEIIERHARNRCGSRSRSPRSFPASSSCPSRSSTQCRS